MAKSFKQSIRRTILKLCDTYLSDDTTEDLVGCKVVLVKPITQQHNIHGAGLRFEPGYTFVVHRATNQDSKNQWYQPGSGYKLVDNQGWPLYNVPRDFFLVVK